MQKREMLLESMDSHYEGARYYQKAARQSLLLAVGSGAILGMGTVFMMDGHIVVGGLAAGTGVMTGWLAKEDLKQEVAEAMQEQAVVQKCLDQVEAIDSTADLG